MSAPPEPAPRSVAERTIVPAVLLVAAAVLVLGWLGWPATPAVPDAAPSGGQLAAAAQSHAPADPEPAVRDPVQPESVIRVLDQATGRPVADALFATALDDRQCDAFSADAVRIVHRTDGTGRMPRALLADVAAGWLLVAHPDYVTRRVQRQDLLLLDRVELARGHRIVVDCVDLAGNPMAAIRVTMSRHPNPLHEPRQDTVISALEDGEVIASLQTGPDGSSTFTVRPEDRIQISVAPPEPPWAFAEGPDWLEQPLPDRIQLRFATLWAVAAVVPAGYGRLVTWSGEGYRTRLAGRPAGAACWQTAASLRQRFPNAIVSARAGLEQEDGPHRLRGRVLLTAGWFSFEAPYVRIDQIEAPTDLALEFEAPVEWGQLQVDLADARGQPVDLGPLEIYTGGPIPALMILGTEGRFEAPVGEYRIRTNLNNRYAVLNEWLGSRPPTVVRQGMLTAERIVLPDTLVPVRIRLVDREGVLPRRANIQARIDRKWYYLGIWSPTDDVRWLQRGTCTLKCDSWLGGSHLDHTIDGPGTTLDITLVPDR